MFGLLNDMFYNVLCIIKFDIESYIYLNRFHDICTKHIIVVKCEGECPINIVQSFFRFSEKQRFYLIILTVFPLNLSFYI